MQVFRNLRVWRAAHELTISVHRVAERFPSSQRYGLAARQSCAGYLVFGS